MATLRALQRFSFFWTPAAKATCLQELAGCFKVTLSSVTQNRAFGKNGSCIQILDSALIPLCHFTQTLLYISTNTTTITTTDDKNIPFLHMQGIIYKKSTSNSRILAFVIFDKKSALFAKSSVILRDFWVKLHKKCRFFEDSGCCPNILDYTLIWHFISLVSKVDSV